MDGLRRVDQLTGDSQLTQYLRSNGARRNIFRLIFANLMISIHYGTFFRDERIICMKIYIEAYLIFVWNEIYIIGSGATLNT